MKNRKPLLPKSAKPAECPCPGNSADNADYGIGILRNSKTESAMKQTAIISGGAVFLPAALFGNQDQIFICCGYDGTETIQDASGRIYAPADWLATEFPEHRQRISELSTQSERSTL